MWKNSFENLAVDKFFGYNRKKDAKYEYLEPFTQIFYLSFFSVEFLNLFQIIFEVDRELIPIVRDR